jgi:hypothetical protein
MTDQIIHFGARLRAKLEQNDTLRGEPGALLQCLDLLNDPIQEAREFCSDDAVAKVLRIVVNLLEDRAS